MSFPGSEVNSRRVLCTGNSPRFTYAKYAQSATRGVLKQSSVPVHFIHTFKCGWLGLIILTGQNPTWLFFLNADMNFKSCSSKAFCYPHFISSFTYHHTIATEGHSLLEHCVLCRAVNKSLRTTAAEIELQLYKIFLNTKKACLKRVCCVIQQKTRPLAKFLILLQKFIFWTYSLLHLAWFMLLFWKSHSETWQAFWQIFSWKLIRNALKSFVILGVIRQ